MRIDEVKLKNFRSFQGEHSLDLRSVHGSNVVLIFGENMSGKTSLFLALWWCLYGKAIGRQGEEIPVFSPGATATNYLINALAVENADYEMLVSLEFQHDGRSWLLERQVRCGGDPLEGDPFTEDAFLRIDGAQLSKHEIRQRVSEVLHPEAAQFYFFDGELLSQYERWLDDDLQREIRVKAAVERTVGTAALRLYSSIDEVAQQAEAEQRRVLTRERRGEQLVAQLEEARRACSDITGEIADYDAAIQALDDEAAQIEREYGNMTSFAEEQGRLSEIARQIDGASQEIEGAEAGIRSLLHEKYWLPLGKRADALQQSLMARLQGAIEGDEDKWKAGVVHRCLESGTCEICQRQLDASSRAHLRGIETDSALETLGRLDVPGVTDVVAQMEACDIFRTSGELDHLRVLEDSLLEARSRKIGLSEEERRIRDEHSDRPRGDREVQMARISTINQKLGSTRLSRAEAVQALINKEEEVRSLQGRANLIRTDPSVQRLARISRLAVRAFQRAIDGFCEAARERVEDGASQVFRQLVTEPGYAGLRIDGNYRLATVDSDGRTLPIPSAGGQQLVTLALIGGLNAAAVHEAPIVMDTPAGRIDRPNRERILRWVQGLDRQVVVMVHSGELTFEDVQHMDVSIGRAYRIEKLTPKSSTVYPVDLIEDL